MVEKCGLLSSNVFHNYSMKAIDITKFGDLYYLAAILFYHPDVEGDSSAHTAK